MSVQTNPYLVDLGDSCNTEMFGSLLFGLRWGPDRWLIVIVLCFNWFHLFMHMHEGWTPNNDRHQSGRQRGLHQGQNKVKIKWNKMKAEGENKV